MRGSKALIETKAGAPLSMREVRDSLLHLYNTGLFEAVNVSAERAGAGGGRWRGDHRRVSPDAGAHRHALRLSRRTRTRRIGAAAAAGRSARRAARARTRAGGGRDAAGTLQRGRLSERARVVGDRGDHAGERRARDERHQRRARAHRQDRHPRPDRSGQARRIHARTHPGPSRHRSRPAVRRSRTPAAHRAHRPGSPQSRTLRSGDHARRRRRAKTDR